MHQSYLYAGDLLGGMSHLEDRLKRVIERACELHSWFRMPAAIIPPLRLWGGLKRARFSRNLNLTAFFDDQLRHRDSAASVGPTGHVIIGIANVRP